MRLLPSERFIAFPPALAARIGVEETLVLCEINYRLGPDVDDGDVWIPASAKTIAEWLPFLSERTVKRVIKSLLDLGVIKLGQRPGFDRSNWVTVCRDHPLLHETKSSNASGQIGTIRSGQIGTMHRAKLAPSLIQESKSKKNKDRKLRSSSSVALATSSSEGVQGEEIRKRRENLEALRRQISGAVGRMP